MPTANTLSTWLAIAATVVGGSIWVGAVASDVATNKQAAAENRQQIDKLRDDGPPAIARLEEQTKSLQRGVEEIKQSQTEILKEIQKK